MSLKQISVFLENKPGTLLSMTGLLAKNHIDMRPCPSPRPRTSASSA